MLSESASLRTGLYCVLELVAFYNLKDIPNRRLTASFSVVF